MLTFFPQRSLPGRHPFVRTVYLIMSLYHEFLSCCGCVIFKRLIKLRHVVYNFLILKKWYYMLSFWYTSSYLFLFMIIPSKIVLEQPIIKKFKSSVFISRIPFPKVYWNHIKRCSLNCHLIINPIWRETLTYYSYCFFVPLLHGHRRNFFTLLIFKTGQH